MKLNEPMVKKAKRVADLHSEFKRLHSIANVDQKLALEEIMAVLKKAHELVIELAHEKE